MDITTGLTILLILQRLTVTGHKQTETSTGTTNPFVIMPIRSSKSNQRGDYEGRRLSTELPTETQPQSVANFIPTDTQSGASFIPTDTQSGANFIPTDTQSGANFIPTDTQSGASFIPTDTQSGANFIPTDTQSGANFIPTDTQSGANFIPTDTQSGASFIPLSKSAAETVLADQTVQTILLFDMGVVSNKTGCEYFVDDCFDSSSGETTMTLHKQASRNFKVPLSKNATQEKSTIFISKKLSAKENPSKNNRSSNSLQTRSEVKPRHLKKREIDLTRSINSSSRHFANILLKHQLINEESYKEMNFSGAQNNDFYSSGKESSLERLKSTLTETTPSTTNNVEDTWETLPSSNALQFPTRKLSSINVESNSEAFDDLRSTTTSLTRRTTYPAFRLDIKPPKPTVPSKSAPLPTSDPWPVKLAAEVPGDLILGGLMMVHEREDSVTCGPIMPQGGIQALETMLYTLDVVNRLPGAPFSIGAHILDDCDKDTYGLEMAVDFIKGSISNIDDAEYHCNKTSVRKVISGVVGAASSVTSIQVANLLRLFKIPQVSFFSTSPELSNKQRFEYFTRTIPSDHYQVKAMVEIVRRLAWSYVSIIYEESNYGIKAFEELEVLLAKYDICIAVKEKLVKDSGVAEETAYDSIVLRLLTKPRARGAIIFGSDQEVAGLMRAVRRCNATGNFSWIGSDGWSARSLVWQGNEREVEGTLSVQPQANPVRGFEEYFLNLTVENNRRNPWFVEFWEHHFQCRYPGSARTPHNYKHTSVCTTRETLTADNTVFENQLQFVSDAVMAFAVALRDMHRELCSGKPGLCDHMRPTKGPDLLKYLRKVNFEGLSGDKFRFDSNGDGPARYNIIHFKQTSAGVFQWLKVGEYIEGELSLNMSDIQFRLGQSTPPESVCSLPCELGQAKQYVEGESCCWHCFNCTQYQVRHALDETQCVMCPEGTVPDPHKQVCLNIPEVFLKAESAWAIGAMCLSASGIIITLLVTSVFVRHNNTPVVKAAGRELSYVLLSGILLCYSVTFILVLRPSNIVCGFQRFGTGFCFTVVYAALFTKTNRISRIFNAGKRTTTRPNFISPKSQLIICCGLVSVQVFINGAWMLVSPPRAIHHYPTREDNLLVCSSYVDASYMIAFTYPILLILVCTVYAVLTRNIPEAFNESKHIGFTMYTTCVIWLAFVPLYFGTGNHMPLRITSMSVTISLSASVTLVCLFSPKLYIILIRPERNVRQSMMPSRHGLFKSGTTASVMVGAAPIAHTHQPFAQVLAQRECIALQINDETKKHKEKVQTTTKPAQTQTTPVMTNNKPHPEAVNNVVNSISSLVEHGGGGL